MIATCPTREELEAFSLGKLPDDSIESIAEHLEACPSCEDTVVQFDDRADTFLENLHGPTPDDPFADESACHEAVSAAKAVAAESSVADQPPVEAPAESLGRIGDYQLLAKLGHGGMGTVYRALHARMRRIVALKVLTTHRRHDPAVVERFGREIEVAGKLSHPNIVTAHDAGEDDGMHYLVMELVEGVDLHTLVSQHGPLPVADACEIIRQAARGLQHAHEHGLVHRDLKPSNLMLAPMASGSRDFLASGGRERPGNSPATSDSPNQPAHAGRSPVAQVKILDLGLARLQDDQKQEREEITATGQVMGTLDYMAPEQANDSHTVDIRSDIYALGCTLSKLLTGHAPFSGETYNSIAKKLRGHAEDPPPPTRAARPEVPEELADLIDGMLAKSPDDRPATPADLAAALEPFCDGCDLPALVAQIDVPTQHDLNAASQAEIAMMLPTPKPGVMSRRRSPLLIFAAVASLLLFVAAAAGIVIAIQRGDGPATTVEVPEGSEVKIDEGGRVAVTLSGDPSPVAGQAVNGLTVSFAVSSTQWKPGDEIELTCSYKNDSSEPIYVPHWGETLPAMEVTRFLDSRVALDAAPANVLRQSLQQLPPAPEVEKQQLWKDIFVEVLPGQTASVIRRGVLGKDGQLMIRWPNGAVQTWNLQNDRFRLEALLESRDDDKPLAKLAREAKFENVWYGKAVSGTVDVTVSGVARATPGSAAVEPMYGGQPLSYWTAQLKDRDAEYRAKAVDALVSFGAAGVDPLVAMLQTGDSDSQVQALSGIERLAAEAQHALPAVIKATVDSDERVRERAAFCLAAYDPQAASAVPALAKLTQDTNHDVREVAVWALWRIRSRPEETVPALIAATQDEDVRVMRAAAFALGDYPDQSEQIVPALAALFETPGLRTFMHIDPSDRVVAAEFLSDEQRKELLEEDWAADWRAISAGSAASYGLSRLGAPGAAKLIELSRREHGGGAIHGLSFSSDPAAIRRLTEMLKDPKSHAPMQALGRAAERDLAAFLAGMEPLESADRAEAGHVLAYFARDGGRSSHQGGFLDPNTWRLLFSREQATQSVFEGLSTDSVLKPTELTVVAAALLDPDRAKQVLPELLQQKNAAKLRATIQLVLRFLDGELPKRDAAGDQPAKDNSPSANAPVDRRPAAEALQEKTRIEFSRARLETVRSHLSDRHDVHIVLDQDVPADTEVSIAIGGVTLETALRQLLGPLNLVFKAQGDRITISRLPTAPVAFYKPKGIVAVRRTWEKGPFDRKTVGIFPDFFDLPLKQTTRLRILDTPGRPGVRLYPTIEVERATGLPRGASQADCLPIPIYVTEEDCDQAIFGNLVKKAVSIDRETGRLVTYMEVQQSHVLTQFGPYDRDETPIADPFAKGGVELTPLGSPLAGSLAGVESIREIRVDPGRNPAVEAERAGSLLAIVRLGNIDLESTGGDAGLQVRAPDYRTITVNDTQSAGKADLPRTFWDRPATLPFGSTFDLGLYSKPVAGVQPPALQVRLEVPPANVQTATFLAHCSIPLRFTDEEYDHIAAGKEVTKVFFLPAPHFRELALAGVETPVSTRLDPGVDPVAEARRQGAVLAVARVTQPKPETVSQSGDGSLLSAVDGGRMLTEDPGEAAFDPFVDKVEHALLRAREQKSADPGRTLDDLKKLRHEVRQFPDAPAEGRHQFLDKITRFIDSEFGFASAKLDRNVELGSSDTAKVPERFLWTPHGPVLVSQDAAQPNGRVEVYRPERRSWALAATLEHVSPPISACVMGEDVGVFAVAQKYSKADAYDGSVVLPENTVQCVRFTPKQVVTSTVFAPPQDGSTGVLAAASYGDIVSVFLMRLPGGEILYLRSADGGKSWPFKPVRVADSMATDRVFTQSGFHLSADHLGLFAYDDQGTPVLLRSLDGGTSWAKESLTPSGPHDPACFPLACFPVDGELGLVYVAKVDRGHKEAKGQFFFARSRDQVRDWTPSEPLGEIFDWVDGAGSVRVSGDSRGKTVVVSYPTLLKRERDPRLNFLMSTSFGVTWKRAGGSQWSSAGSAATISPNEDRILFAAHVEDPYRVKLQHQLLVKEFDLVEGKRTSRLPFWDDEPNGTETEQDEKQDAPSDEAATNRGE